MLQLGQIIYCVDFDKRRKKPYKVVSGQLCTIVTREYLTNYDPVVVKCQRDYAFRNGSDALRNGSEYPEGMCFSSAIVAQQQCDKLNATFEQQKNFKL